MNFQEIRILPGPTDTYKKTMSNTQQVHLSPDTNSITLQNNHDEENRIIAELCAGAPTDLVRNCFRKYDSKKTAWQIEKELKKDKKDVW